ncbi:hypothetical protein C0992_001607 [Termitomyces sp. T32_za158]|nr:hypothetical protein C0992_001607 [Termitomyces sp. T32_za158]
MNSPSPSKPKWNPGGAIRRTSTLLSIGRSKTPSRSSSIRESDSSPAASKGVAAAPITPAPKPVPPKPTLSTGSPSQEPTATPSKSALARMGTALRRPSSLIPRRRTTSTASSFRDGDSMAASAMRSSADLGSAIRSNPPAEPAAPQALKSTVPEPRSSVPESEHVLSPVSESPKSAGKPEETPSLEVVGHSDLSSPRAPASAKEALDEPLAISPSDLAPILLLGEQLSKDPELKAETLSPAPLSTPELASEQSRTPLVVEEPSIIPSSASGPVPAPLTTDAVVLSSVIEQSTVIISTTEAVPPSPIFPTQSVPKIEDVLLSTGPTTQQAIVEAPPVVTSLLPVTEVGIAPSNPNAEPLRDVSSLNSSFEDLALSTQPVEDEVVIVHKDAVMDHSSVLLTPVGATSVPIETTEKEKVSPVAVEATAEEPPSIKSTVPILEIAKETKVDTPVITALPITQEPRRSLPLEIPTTSAESAAPSPAATHPLLPLEIQEFPPRQNNGTLGPARDHHTKTPQEYKSMLRMLFDGLIGLIKQWKRCVW